MGDLAPRKVTMAIIPAPFALRDPFARWFRLFGKLESIVRGRTSSVISSHHFIRVIRVIFNQNKSRITIYSRCSAFRCVESVQSTQVPGGMLHSVLRHHMLARHCCCIRASAGAVALAGK